MRTVLLTAAALSAPHASRVSAQHGRTDATTPLISITGLLPTVSVNIDQFAALAPENAYDDIIAEAAGRYKLDPMMIKAVMQTESSFDALAVSPAGAVGLMQLMPAVALELGADDPMDPRQNVMAGARHLRQLLDSHRGSLSLALASYNAGAATVAKYRGIPPFKETRNYVKRVTALLQDAKADASN